MRMQSQADAGCPTAVTNSIADSGVGPDFRHFEEFLARTAQDNANAALNFGHHDSVALDVDMHSLMAHDFMM